MVEVWILDDMSAFVIYLELVKYQWLILMLYCLDLLENMKEK